MGKSKNEIKQPVKKESNVFTKEQLMNSKTFIDDRDILYVVINDDEKLSNDEVRKRIENFKKGKVK